MVFATGSTPTTQTVACMEISWTIENGVQVFQPAALKIIKDLLGEEKFAPLLVYFGTVSERVRFQVKFGSDDEWWSFRNFQINDSYFKEDAKDYPTNFYWGESSGKFYNDGNTIYANLPTDKYAGLITKSMMTKDVISGTWQGSIEFVLGLHLNIDLL